MMRRARVAAAAAVGVALLAGCRSIPSDASVKEFCDRGESFSASTSFETGRKRAEKLADVGTPEGIDKRARKGFEELIDRVTGADDGADFKKKANSISADERKNLEALNVYIQKTCDLS